MEKNEEQKQTNYNYSDIPGVVRYQQPQKAYATKAPNPSQVKQLRKAVKEDITALKKEIRAVLQRQSLHGTGIDKLAQEYLAGDSEVRNQMANIKHAVIPADMQSSQTGVPFDDKQLLQLRVYKAENQLIQEKTGLAPSGTNLKAIGQHLGLYKDGAWVQGMSDSKMREMILLDDFADFFKSIAKVALPLVSQIPGVGPVLGPIANAIGPSLIDTGASAIGKLLGNPTGGIDHHKYTAAPLVKETTAGTTVTDRNIRVQSLRDAKYRYNLVDLNTIATSLVPEYFKYPARYDDVQPSAVYTSFFEIPVVPTPTGTFFLIVNANQVFASAATNFISYTNNTMTYSPTTGAFTGVATNIDNPGITNTNNLASMRLVGMNVTYKPTVLTNTQYASGQVDLYHDPGINTPSTSFTVSPSTFLSLTNIGYRPFYQRGPVVQEFSQVWFNPLSTTDFTPTTSTTTGVQAPIILIVSGANVNGVQIATITVSLVWNVMPTAAGLAGLPMQNPGVGPATPNLVRSVATLKPQAYMADMEERMSIMTALYDTDGSYEEVLKVFCCSGTKKKHVNPYTSASQSRPMQSLDISLVDGE